MFFESSFLLNCQVIQTILGHKSMDFKDIYKQAHEGISSLIYEQFTIIDLKRYMSVFYKVPISKSQ